MWVFNTFDGALADDGFIDMLVTVPADVHPHSRFQGASGASAVITVYEDTTSLPGSPLNLLTPQNLNRGSSRRSPLTTVHSAPALSSPLGDLILGPILIPGGTGGNASGGYSSLFQELILKDSTVYLFRLQNIGGTVQPIVAQLAFHEN